MTSFKAQPQWPQPWLDSLPLSISERNLLLESLQQEPTASIRINPSKARIAHASAENIPWSTHGYYLSQRPRYTSDPAFHAGAYYPQEASSMFIDHVVRSLKLHEQPITALDLCAAPGGKSTLLRSTLHPDSFLLANEVVGNRVNLLEENLLKWGIPGYAISQSDPSKFAHLGPVFDLLLVDAPCSGEGMFRKDMQALEHWSPANVEACALRQKRILEGAWPALKPGGILIYSTCTYNLSENEEQLERFAENHGVDFLEFAPADSGIVRSHAGSVEGHRFYPHKVQGEGFFCAVMRKTNENSAITRSAKSVQRKKRFIIENEVPCNVQHQNIADGQGRIYALRNGHMDIVELLSSQLNIIVPGHTLGQRVHGTFKPAQGMAFLAKCSFPAESFELNLEEALKYLSRQDVPSAVKSKTPVLVQFEKFNLGWARAQSGRLQSMYPMHWRIREGKPEAYFRVVKHL